MATPTNLPASFTSGNVLTAAQMNDLRGAFRILQVVSATTTTLTATASTTWVDTTLTASITPQSTSSKILVIPSHSLYNFTAGTGGGLRIDRSGTVILTHADCGLNTGGNAVTQWMTQYLDSPATTSALTYKTQQNRGTGSGTFYTQVNGNPATLILMEVSA
jgi:hypothetical protein